MNWSVNWFRVLSALIVDVILLAFFCFITYNEGVKSACIIFGVVGGVCTSGCGLAWLAAQTWGKLILFGILIISIELLVIKVGWIVLLNFGLFILAVIAALVLVALYIFLDDRAKVHDKFVRDAQPKHKDELT